MLLYIYLLYKFCGVARNYCIGRNVMRDDRICADDGILSNGHALQHRGIYTYPHAVLDDDGLCHRCTAQRRVERMVERYKIDFGSDEHIVAYGYASPVHKRTPLLYPHVFAYSDIATIIGIKGRQYCQTFVDFVPQYLAYLFAVTFIEGRPLVIRRKRVHRLRYSADNFAIFGVVRANKLPVQFPLQDILSFSLLFKGDAVQAIHLIKRCDIENERAAPVHAVYRPHVIV